MMRNAFLALLLLTAPLYADMKSPRMRTPPPPPATFAEADTAAAQGLAAMRDLAARHPDFVGVSAVEAAFAHLLEPLQVRFVSVDALAAFGAGSEPSTVLYDVKTLYYPVAVGDAVRALVVVSQVNGAWRVARVGSANVAIRIAELQLTMPEGNTVVFAPGLNLHFLANSDGGRLRLSPFSDVAGTDFRGGVAVDAATLFARLAPQARTFRREPQ